MNEYRLLSVIAASFGLGVAGTISYVCHPAGPSTPDTVKIPDSVPLAPFDAAPQTRSRGHAGSQYAPRTAQGSAYVLALLP